MSISTDKDPKFNSSSSKTPMPPFNMPLPPPPAMLPNTAIPPPSLNPPTGTAASSTLPPANIPPQYQAYYQQYYQYMYSSMYSNPSMMQAYMAANPNASAAIAAAAAASMQKFYNQNTAAAAKAGQPPPPPSPSLAQPASTQSSIGTSSPSITKLSEPLQQKPQIKFNLKFQQQQKLEGEQRKAEAPPKVKKSRFDQSALIQNVTNEQKSFEEKKEQQEVVKTLSAPLTASGEITKTYLREEKPHEEEHKVSSNARDIVYDMQKWPAALKAYCGRVFQHYSQVSTIDDEQVTKYLQQRIIDVFNVNPTLNIDWEKEPLPDVCAIKKVAPFSKAQLEAQKLKFKMQQAQRAAATASPQMTGKKAPILAKPSTLGHMAKEVEQKMESKKAAKRRTSSSSASRSRSSSRSSTSSTTSSASRSSPSSKLKKTDEYIPLSNNRKFHQEGEFVLSDDRLSKIDLSKLSNKQRKKLLYKQRLEALRQQKQQNNGGASSNVAAASGGGSGNAKFGKNKAAIAKLNTNIDNFFLLNRNKSSGNLASIREPFQRKQIRSFFELEREQMLSNEQDVIVLSSSCVGQSQDLEKQYLRLTGPPEPNMIRPLHVLKMSLDFVLKKYEKSKDYRYICDQMKAIRQDLTVQMIRNEFTIKVYETHARIALKNKDRDEFNQCQNQLKNLYNTVKTKDYTDHSAEFIGYRLLYNILTKSYKDINQVILEIKQKHSENKYLKHLVELKNAWYLNNYIKFFKLYSKSNELSKCLIDLFIERERKQALKCILKSYRPTIKLETVAEMLAYDSLDTCRSDLVTKYNLVLIQDNTSLNEDYLDCKSCSLQSL